MKTTAGNLISRTTAENVIRPPGFYSSIILDVLIILSALVLGFSYHGFLKNEISLIWAILAFSFFALFSIFGMLLTKNTGRRIGIIMLSVLCIMTFFYYLPFPFLVGSGIAAFLFLFWGEMLSRRELQNSLNIKFFKIVNFYLGKMITAIALLAALLFLPQWDASANFISPSAFSRLYDFSSRVVEIFYPELKVNSSVGTFIQSFAEFQLRNNPLFLQLLPAAKDQIIQETSKQISARLSEWAKIEINSDAPLSSFLYKLLVKFLKDWRENFGNKFMLTSGIVLFLILRSVGWLLHLILVTLGFFIYQSLLAVNFIRVVGESRMREILEYS